MVLPLVPLAGFASARVAAATRAEDKLVVFKAQAAGHAGTGISPPVGGTHRDEAVRTVAREALEWSTRGKLGRRFQVRVGSVLGQ